MSSQDDEDDLEKAVQETLIRICGGGVPCPRKSSEHMHLSWHDRLRQLTKQSFYKSNGCTMSKRNKVDQVIAGGKAHDLESKIALILFHQFKCNCCFDGSSQFLHITSDFGFTRSFQSPFDFSEMIVKDLTQDDCIVPGYDIRSNQSGILCIVSPARCALLRMAGKLPCSFCVKWCNGEKGLWSHEQQEHGNDFAKNRALLIQQAVCGALIVYNSDTRLESEEMVESQLISSTLIIPNGYHVESIFNSIKAGHDLDFIHTIHEYHLEPSTLIDKHGASPLHWAAGCGNLDLVTYLITKGHCDPNLAQRGTRSYGGRTPIHWAARNGHLNIVSYLVEIHQVDIDAETMDGTTAFCWAAWQGHLHILEYLAAHKCNIDKVNKYSCNAVLWAAQSQSSENLACLQWLDSIGCDVDLINTNGHGILHKAAQRGRRSICEWVVSKSGSMDLMKQIGPDVGDHCPSDLAGMEGHIELAKWLAQIECKIAEQLLERPKNELFHWVHKGMSEAHSVAQTVGIFNVWEAHGGIRRISAHLVNIRATS